MRTPHRITTHPYTNPYEELAALDDGPLDEFLHEDVRDEQTEQTEQDDAAAQDDPWVPPNHRRNGRRRRRGRLAGLPLALKAVIALVVLACFLTLGDRWALLYAERRAADTLKDRFDLAAAPEVEIGGFPFLTQLADERLDSVRVTVPDVAADRISLAQVTATAKDVRLDTDGPTAVRGADVPTLQGDVLLSFADLNRELGASQVTFTGEGRDRVRARGTLPVAGHDLRLRAEARILRDGDRGIATHIGGMRLDIGDLATYRPGTRAADGLHLSRESAARLAHETRKAKALLSIPSVVRRLGVPDSVVREALRDEAKLADLTGTPRFLHQAMRLNLIDLALDHPALLKRLGFDPALLDALPRLTRPVLADQLSLGFRLPEPPSGALRLRDVRVEEDGIRVRLEGAGLAVGGK
ncbi:LmeA family phospholipid-binding protein [Streptomyces sp. SD31]|uniref:LmeA family phospholipid-binding protein n=1 Tax=Streptomyces sp. SD31 TaxID=3452208 RepID=UPI003F8AA1A9